MMVQISVPVEKSIQRRLKVYTAKHEITVKDFVSYAISEMLDRVEGDEKILIPTTNPQREGPTVVDAIKVVFKGESRALGITDVMERIAANFTQFKPSYNHVMVRLNELQRAGYLAKVGRGKFRLK